MGGKYKDRRYDEVSAGSYPWIPLDHYAEPFELTYAIFVSGAGQASASIDGTLDDPMTQASCKAFFLVSAISSAITYGSLEIPMAAIRYRVGTVSGSLDVTFQTLQGG